MVASKELVYFSSGADITYISTTWCITKGKLTKCQNSGNLNFSLNKMILKCLCRVEYFIVTSSCASPILSPGVGSSTIFGEAIQMKAVGLLGNSP